MGANGSTPRTAEFLNPTREPHIILISEQVSDRIEGRKRQSEPSFSSVQRRNEAENYVCKKCGSDKKAETPIITEERVQPMKPLPKPSIYQIQTDEIEKEEFDKTLKKLDETIGKQADWTVKHEVELKSLQDGLLQCYKDYPRETLRCHKNARDYETFVYEKQYETILKHTLNLGGSGDH